MALKKIRTKTAPPFAFLHAAKVAAYEKVPEVGGKIMDVLMPWVVKKKIALAGAALWSYQNHAPGKLKLKAGFQVPAGTPAPKGFVVKTEPAWECLSAEYTGPMTLILDAWYELMAAAEKRGLECTEDRREIYHKWVTFDSEANVTELQIRVKPEAQAKAARSAAPKTKRPAAAQAKSARPKAKPVASASARTEKAKPKRSRPKA